MSRWTDEELRELVTLWPTNSASEIAKRLHRLRSAVRGKAARLRQEGLLPSNLPKRFDVNPPKRPPPAAETKDHGRGATTIRRRQLRDPAVPSHRDRLSPLSPAGRDGQRSCLDDQRDRN